MEPTKDWNPAWHYSLVGKSLPAKTILKCVFDFRNLEQNILQCRMLQPEDEEADRLTWLYREWVRSVICLRLTKRWLEMDEKTRTDEIAFVATRVEELEMEPWEYLATWLASYRTWMKQEHELLSNAIRTDPKRRRAGERPTVHQLRLGAQLEERKHRSQLWHMLHDEDI